MEQKETGYLKVFRLLKKGKSLPIMGVYIIMLGIFMIFSPDVFFRPVIYMSFLQTVPPQLILALGLTLVITAGEIDLSFSAVVAFSGFIFYYVYKNLGQHEMAAWIALFMALGGGALVGWINGLLVAKLKIPSIMATLATQFFWNGVTILLCEGLSGNIKEIRGSFIHTVFTGKLFGLIPAQAIWALGVSILLWFILNRHRFGEALMFIGDNPEVARVMGVNIERTKIKLFTLHGLTSGFAGVLLTLEMVNFWSTQGAGFLLPVMAAVFIGGTSITGGEGLIFGTFFGAYIMGSLEPGIVATGIGGYWVRPISGLVMLASLIINAILKGGKGTFAQKMERTVFVKAFKRLKRWLDECKKHSLKKE